MLTAVTSRPCAITWDGGRDPWNGGEASLESVMYQLPMLPADLAAEMHVKGADLGTLECRKWLLDIANGTVQQAPDPI